MKQLCSDNSLSGTEKQLKCMREVVLDCTNRCFQNSSKTFFLLNSSNKGTEAKHINFSERDVVKLKKSFFYKSIV